MIDIHKVILTDTSKFSKGFLLLDLFTLKIVLFG